MSEAQIFKFYKRNKSRISRCRTMFKNFMKMTRRESDQLCSSLLLWFHLKSGQTLITFKAEIKLRFKYILWVTFYIRSRLKTTTKSNSKSQFNAFVAKKSCLTLGNGSSSLLHSRGRLRLADSLGRLLELPRSKRHSLPWVSRLARGRAR